MTDYNRILNALPYKRPYLFVDEIISISDDEVVSKYCFKDDEFFYSGHFTDSPVVPGFIILEAAGQMGPVCLGIYNLKLWGKNKFFKPVIASLEADFYHPVSPGDTIVTHTNKVYLKNQVLKCSMKVVNQNGVHILSSNTISKFLQTDE